MSDLDTNEQVDTHILRARLESADAALARALVKRWQTAMAIDEYALKAASEVFDPATQARNLRQFMRSVTAYGGPAVPISRAWRTLIGDQIAEQAGRTIVAAGSDDREIAAARDYFGSGPSVEILASPRAVLSHLAAGRDAIACLPWPSATGLGRWWPMLNESAYDDIYILGSWPLSEPIIAVIARGSLRPSGADDMLAVAHDDLCQAEAVLADAQLSGRVVARMRSLVLCVLDGYVEADDSRFARARADGLDGLRLIGVAQKP